MSHNSGWGPQGPYAPPYGGWAPPPFAPKPGIIPLAPLGVGDILGGVFGALGRGAKLLLAVSATVFTTATVVTLGLLVLAWYIVRDHAEAVLDPPYGTDPASSDIVPVVVAFGLAYVVVIAVALTAVAAVYAACLVVLQDTVLGRPPAFGDAWRRTWARTPALTGLHLLLAAMVFVPVLLLALIPLGSLLADGTRPSDASLVIFGLGMLALLPLAAWLYVRYSLASAVVVLERQRPTAALRRSAELVRSSWWRTFGILLLVAVIASVVGSLVSMPFTYGGVFGALAMMPGGDPEPAELIGPVAVVAVTYLIGLVISQFISTVLPQLTVGLLYIDRRIRTEGLAPALAEAAGTPMPPPPPYPYPHHG